MIRKGEEWGSAVARPADLVVAGDDRELAALVTADRARPLAVRAGDLARTIAAASDVESRATLQRVDIDVLHVVADGDELLAVAHVVARRGWWRGPLVGAFNAQFLGEWDVAPRGHPNDGRADIVEVSPTLSPRARWAARRRLPSGTHVPHPDIATSQRATAEWDLTSPLDLYVDGRRHGRVRTLRVTVEPDAFQLHL